MHEENENLLLIKEKIIKTDQVISLLSKKKTEHSNLLHRYKELSVKYVSLKKDTDLKLENNRKEHSKFAEHLIECKAYKSKHDELENEYNSLQITYNDFVAKSESKYLGVCDELIKTKERCNILMKQVTQLETKILEQRANKPKNGVKHMASLLFDENNCKMCLDKRKKLQEYEAKNMELIGKNETLIEKQQQDAKQIAKLTLQLANQNKYRTEEPKSNAQNANKIANLQQHLKEANTLNEQLQAALDCASTNQAPKIIEKKTVEVSIQTVSCTTIVEGKESLVKSPKSKKAIKYTAAINKLEDELLQAKLLIDSLETALEIAVKDAKKVKPSMRCNVSVQTEDSCDSDVESEDIDKILAEMKIIPRVFSPLSFDSIVDNIEIKVNTLEPTSVVDFEDYEITFLKHDQSTQTDFISNCDLENNSKSIFSEKISTNSGDFVVNDINEFEGYKNHNSPFCHYDINPYRNFMNFYGYENLYCSCLNHFQNSFQCYAPQCSNCYNAPFGNVCNSLKVEKVENFVNNSRPDWNRPSMFPFFNNRHDVRINAKHFNKNILDRGSVMLRKKRRKNIKIKPTAKENTIETKGSKNKIEYPNKFQDICGRLKSGFEEAASGRTLNSQIDLIYESNHDGLKCRKKIKESETKNNLSELFGSSSEFEDNMDSAVSSKSELNKTNIDIVTNSFSGDSYDEGFEGFSMEQDSLPSHVSKIASMESECYSKSFLCFKGFNKEEIRTSEIEYLKSKQILNDILEIRTGASTTECTRILRKRTISFRNDSNGSPIRSKKPNVKSPKILTANDITNKFDQKERQIKSTESMLNILPLKTVNSNNDQKISNESQHRASDACLSAKKRTAHIKNTSPLRRSSRLNHKLDDVCLGDSTNLNKKRILGESRKYSKQNLTRHDEDETVSKQNGKKPAEEDIAKEKQQIFNNNISALCDEDEKHLDNEVSELAHIAGKAQKTTFKRPNCLLKQSECPSSPDAEEMNRIDPNCLVNIIPFTAPRMYKISSIKYFLANLTINHRDKIVVQETMSKLVSQPVEVLASSIVDFVRNDIGTKYMNSESPFAPLLSKTQRILLVTMNELEAMSMKNLFLSFLSEAERVMLNEKELKHLESVHGLYLAVCKLTHNIDRIRRMCCDVFYFTKEMAISFLYLTLRSWIDVIPSAVEDEGFPLAKIFVHIIHQTPATEYKADLVDMLTQYHKYPKEKYNDDELMTELVEKLTEGNPNLCIDAAILLLCKYQTTDWCYLQIQRNLQLLCYKTNNKNLIARTVLLVNNIVKRFDTSLPKIKEYVANVALWIFNLRCNLN